MTQPKPPETPAEVPADPSERAGQRLVMDYEPEILQLPDNTETVKGPVGQTPTPPTD